MSQSNLSRLISPRSIAVVGHRGADFAIEGALNWVIPEKFGRFIHLGKLLKG